jgi:hypothetical protein
MARIKKTDNSYLADKISLRANHLPDGEIRVLDAFGGRGKVWGGVAFISKRKIRRLPIEKKEEDGFHLPGDNLKYFGSLDLNRFNAIDLDAYGVPYSQLVEVFSSGFAGWVYVTFIQSMFGALPVDFLVDCGFSKEMIKKTPALFYKRGWKYFINWLAKNGVKTIYHRSRNRKHYLAFNCVEVSVADCNIQQAGKAANHA